MTPERDGDHDDGAGFTTVADGGRWAYAGPLTYANARDVLAASVLLPLPSAGEIDIAEIGAVDSAAVAVLLALKRRAATEGRPLTFAHIPAALMALADLYGVEEMLVA